MQGPLAETSASETPRLFHFGKIQPALEALAIAFLMLYRTTGYATAQ